MALSADTDVFHITGLHIQQATCHNLTLIIKRLSATIVMPAPDRIFPGSDSFTRVSSTVRV